MIDTVLPPTTPNATPLPVLMKAMAKTATAVSRDTALIRKRSKCMWSEYSAALETRLVCNETRTLAPLPLRAWIGLHPALMQLDHCGYVAVANRPSCRWRLPFAWDDVRVTGLSELMRGAHAVPVLVRYRIWHDHALGAAAREATGQELVGPRRIGQEAAELQQSEIIVSIWRSGDRQRVEYAGGLEDGSYGVRVGESWWSWNSHHGRANSSDDSPPESVWIGKGADAFLDPSGLHDALRFGPVSHATRVGRPVFSVDAWARSTPDDGVAPDRVPRVIGVHADRYRLQVDAEHGIILSAHAFFADQAFQTIDVIELQFDGPVNEELFTFPEPPTSQTAA